MKTSSEYLLLSKERLETARRILDVTYPALKSPRLLLSCLEHLFLSMDYAMNGVLAHERMRGAAGTYPSSFMGRFGAFRTHLSRRLGFDSAGAEALLSLRSILLLHRKSPMEFEREGKFIICTNDYEMTQLTQESMEAYLVIASAFLSRAMHSLEQPLSTQGDSPSP